MRNIYYLPFTLLQLLTGKRPIVPAIPKGSECPDGMVWLDDTYCMAAHEDEFVNYDDAKAACEKLHPTSTLASLHSKNELNSLSGLINSSSPVWIGLHKTDRRFCFGSGGNIRRCD